MKFLVLTRHEWIVIGVAILATVAVNYALARLRPGQQPVTA